MECLALWPLFSAQCIQLSYQDFATQSWADNQGSCRGLQLPSYRFRSQGSKRRETVAKHLEKRVWKICSVCLGFCVDDPNLRLRIPKVTCHRHGYLGILWGSSQYPERLDTKVVSSGSTIDASFPLLWWDDDDKRETVSNTKVSKWQTFSNKTLCRSCELSSKLWVTQKETNRPYPITIFLRTFLKPRPFRVFCALVPCLVVEHGS